MFSVIFLCTLDRFQFIMYNTLLTFSVKKPLLYSWRIIMRCFENQNNLLWLSETYIWSLRTCQGKFQFAVNVIQSVSEKLKIHLFLFPPYPYKNHMHCSVVLLHFYNTVFILPLILWDIFFPFFLLSKKKYILLVMTAFPNVFGSTGGDFSDITEKRYM